MKKSSIRTVLLLSVLTSPSLQAQPFVEIQKQVDRFLAAWNVSDDAEMAKIFVEKDGYLLDPFGKSASGRQSVQMLFRAQHKVLMRGSTFKILGKVEKPVGAQGDVVLQDWEVELINMRRHDNSIIPALRMHVAVAWAKVGADWLVQGAHCAVRTSLPTG